MRHQETTHTKLVNDWLIAHDDFASRKMISEGTKLKPNQVRAALSGLARYHAVEAMIVNQTELWFFATPKLDTRTLIVAARVPTEHRKDKKPRNFGPRKTTKGEIPKSYRER